MPFLKDKITKMKKAIATQNVSLCKRTKKLCLTQKGLDLEAKLSKIQIDKIKSIINDAKESDINGFKKFYIQWLMKNQKKYLINLMSKDKC